MAMPCGHRADPDTKVGLVEAGKCPACRVPLYPFTGWVVPYGVCGCCGARWAVRDGEVYEVVFG